MVAVITYNFVLPSAFIFEKLLGETKLFNTRPLQTYPYHLWAGMHWSSYNLA
jgi:hypothetical protein